MHFVDRWFRPVFYLLFLSAICAEIWLLFWADSGTQKLLLIPGTIFFSAIAATCGWLWSGHINRAVARRQQARALLEFLYQAHVVEWKKKVFAAIEERKPLNDPGFPAEDAHLLLSVLEQTCVCIMRRTADEDSIRESQRLVFKRLYDGLRGLIDDANGEDKSYYCHFKHYARTWNSVAYNDDPIYVPPAGDVIDR